MDAASPLAQALEAVPTPLAVMHSVRDATGDIVDFEWDYINAAGAKEILVERDELIGQRLLVKLPDHRNGLFDLYKNVVESGEPFVLTEAGLDDKWGTEEIVPRIYDIRSTKLGDGICIWWSDVTERVSARLELESRAQAAAITEMAALNAPIGQALLDENGVFTSVNPAYCRIVGRSKESLVGATFQAITYPDDLESDTTQLAELRNRTIDRYSMEKRYVRPDGAIVWVRLHATAVWADSKFVTYIGQVSDIGEEVKLRTFLEARNRDLEQFAYVASHDLQAPLRTISLYFDLFVSTLDPTELTEEQADHANEIRQAITHMRELTSDLLELSRINRVDLDSTTANVREMVSRSIASIASDLTEAECEIGVDVPEDLWASVNATHLKQIVCNLLSNSIKYRERERQPEIYLAARPIGVDVVLTVTDNGIGIRPGSEERAFQMFQRLQSDGEGTGIGLALVRMLAERSGGTASLESDGVSGTKVTVTLPLALPR